MTNSKLLPAALAALLLTTAGSGIAVAQSAPRAPEAPAAAEAGAEARELRAQHRRGDGNGPHRVRGHRGGEHGGFGFGRGRGGSERFQRLFAEIDADGDGAVTQEEVDAYRSARVAAADASGDGALSIEEFDTLYREFTRDRMVDAFQDLDSDGDGVISTEEFDFRFGSIVERMDRDGDGALTLQMGRGDRPGDDSDDDNE
ncbi:MAG: EF-hand domain-containing protein [Pseudomonadota bacterium]